MWIKFEITEDEIQKLHDWFIIHQDTIDDDVLKRVLNRIINSLQCRPKEVRNSQIYDMRCNQYSYSDIAREFGISRERARQIFEREEQNRRLSSIETKTDTNFLECLEKANEELGGAKNLPIRTYKSLLRCGIIQAIQENNISLNEFSDSKLLSIRNFGIASLDITRKAYEIYTQDIRRNDDSRFGRRS